MTDADPVADMWAVLQARDRRNAPRPEVDAVYWPAFCETRDADRAAMTSAPAEGLDP